MAIGNGKSTGRLIRKQNRIDIGLEISSWSYKFWQNCAIKIFFIQRLKIIIGMLLDRILVKGMRSLENNMKH
jgi:hypothetical protein